MGKSEDQLKSKTKQIQKSPISMFWMGTSPSLPFVFSRLVVERTGTEEHAEGLDAWSLQRVHWLTCICFASTAILGFIIFGGLIFEGPISILRLKRGNQTLYGKR